MKIAIIGCGGIAKAHARAISTFPETALVGAYDIDPAKAADFTGRFGGEPFPALEEAFAVAEGVIVASPNFCHYEHAVRALRAGVHVLCEKPIATTADDAGRMVELAEQVRTVAAVGFNYRQLPVVREIRSRVAAGRIGDVCSIDLSFHKDSAFRRKTFTWRDSGNTAGTGGALGDLGVHLIDLAEHVTGRSHQPASIRSHRVTVVPEKEGNPVAVDDHSEGFAVLDGGIQFRLSTSKAASQDERGVTFKVVGTAGTLHWCSAEGGRLYEGSRAGWHITDLDMPLLADPPTEFHGWSDSFRLQLVRWARTCHGADATMPTFADGHHVQQVLEQYVAGQRVPARAEVVGAPA
ncbi:Gfo/Idh/MocA family oxidoreductase [Saccharopolyspora cebuensis]|uniref:Gfo/Idh/MocA family protein n=1 Tax=Saccharopolyspora cebuensis TaxID=418759 RepID=A0ABV4CF42_9PSEU